MKHVLLMACLALTVSAVPAFAQKSDDAQAQKGMKVFTDQKCSMCHSIGGHGNPKGPLDEVGSKLSADEIRQWITDAPTMAAKSKATRAPAMKTFKNLSKEDVDALVAFLRTLKKK
jgi:mono/diheme cytochrome c family protein